MLYYVYQHLACAIKRERGKAAYVCVCVGNPAVLLPPPTSNYRAGVVCVAGLGAWQVQLVAESGLSVAMFAPGWSLECGEACSAPTPEHARHSDRAFWLSVGLGPSVV